MQASSHSVVPRPTADAALSAQAAYNYAAGLFNKQTNNIIDKPAACY